MKATGIIRRLDILGRIVLPKELRRELDIEHGNQLEMYLDGRQVVLQKYAPACVFCGEDATQELKGRAVCAKCAAELEK